MIILDIKNYLNFNSKDDFYTWLHDNHQDENECWIEVKKGKPIDNNHLWYLDAVEVALCYGWIDNINKIIDGKRLQRFSKRNKNSPWTELNKERVRRLEKLGLMTESGRRVLPHMGFRIDKDIEDALKKARVWTKFRKFPLLYQRVRSYNVSFYKNRNKDIYNKALKHLIDETKNEKMYGQWNDYGRLLDY